MSILTTQVIPIEYDEKTETLALELKKYLEENKDFFTFFLPKTTISLINEQRDLFIKSKEELLEHLEDISIENAKEFLNPTPIQEDSEKYILLYLWKERLLKSQFDFPIDGKIMHINSIWNYVKTTRDYASYYQYTHGNQKEVEDKIFKWYQETYRAPLLNLLLDIQIQLFKQEYSSDILPMITEVNRIIDEESKREEIPYLEKLTQYIPKEESLSLISEFLITLDPTLTWYQEFLELQKNNKIIENKNAKRLKSKKALNWQVLYNGQEWYLYAPWQYTLADSINFIHEFAHYMFLKGNKESDKKEFFLSELPSIFLEYAMCDFLRNKGHPEEEINKRINFRLSETTNYCMDIESIVERMERRIKGEEITLEQEIEEIQEIERKMKQKNQNFSFERDYHKTIEEIATSYIDMDIITLLKNSNVLYTTIPYIVGNHYALDLRTRKKEATQEILSICSRQPFLSIDEMMSELSLSTRPKTAKKKELK